MKRLLISLAGVVILGGLVVILQNSPALSGVLWNLSRGGVWLLPLVLVAAVLDSVHPCSFSILLITIAFLFGMQMSRRRILEVGSAYIFGIFASYFLIGLGLLKVLHLFNTPHFMGKVGAALLIGFGLLNLINFFWPRFPLKLKLPAAAHSAMGRLIDKASLPTAFGLGILVGLCQFPCLGGPYLMVIGLLRDQVTYASGFVYLLLYNVILILPLLVVLWLAANKAWLDILSEWRRSNVRSIHLWAGIAMVILGLLVLII